MKNKAIMGVISLLLALTLLAATSPLALALDANCETVHTLSINCYVGVSIPEHPTLTACQAIDVKWSTLGRADVLLFFDDSYEVKLVITDNYDFGALMGSIMNVEVIEVGDKDLEVRSFWRYLKAELKVPVDVDLMQIHPFTMVVKGYGRATRSEYGPEVMGGYTVYQLTWVYQASATINVLDCDLYSASYALVYPTYMKITE
jgi:hypothetical protein